MSAQENLSSAPRQTTVRMFSRSLLPISFMLNPAAAITRKIPSPGPSLEILKTSASYASAVFSRNDA